MRHYLSSLSLLLLLFSLNISTASATPRLNTPNYSVIPDFNNDGLANTLDFNIFTAELGTSGPSGTDLDGSGFVNLDDFDIYVPFHNEWTVSQYFEGIDFNNDAKINTLDLNIFKSEFGTTGASGTDLDGNGFVSYDDLDIFGYIYDFGKGQDVPGATSVPEPGVTGLLAIGFLLTFFNRRKSGIAAAASA